MSRRDHVPVRESPDRSGALFTEVFRANYVDVLGFLRRRVDRDVADDLAAETFAIAWDQWSETPNEARPWLFGIARTLVASSHRADGRRKRLELRVQGERAPADPDPGHLAAFGADLRVAWAQLSENDREVIALVAWDGLTGREAARVLRCTRAAFSVRLSRARRRLRRHLEDAEPDLQRTDVHVLPSPLAVDLAEGGQS